jgi:hypothetical protein
MGVLEPAICALAELPIREIFLFDEFLSWRLYTLDTREHALNFAPGQEYHGYVNDTLPFSTDSFIDCRAMVIARGQLEYEKVLADPTRMAKESFESFQYLAKRAFSRKTGKGYEYEVGIHTWAGCNRAGWMPDAITQSDSQMPSNREGIELRIELTPPVLSSALVDRLAKLADRLDGAFAGECDEVLAKFNRLVGIPMALHEFQGINSANSPESFVRNILYRCTLVPDPALCREEMAEIVKRIRRIKREREFYVALFCVNCKHPAGVNLIYWPSSVPDMPKDRALTNEEVADIALSWEPRVVAMQIAERRGGGSVDYYIYTLTAPNTPSAQVVTGLNEKYDVGTVLAVALKGMRLRDGSIVQATYPYRVESCGKILGITGATLGSRLE